MNSSIRYYKKKECITFKSTKGQYGGLSNMAADFPVYLNDLMIKNVEALYQSLRFPDFPDIQRNILKYNSPISAKKHSRQFIENTRSDWNIYRFNIMKFCLQVKFYYHPKIFGNILLNTDNKSIVEFTFEDKVWGAVENGDHYEGTTALGRLLMELRENIKDNQFKLEIPKIGNFKLLEKEITHQSFSNIL